MNGKCPACGANLAPMSLKCPECGTVFSQESASSKAIRDEFRDFQTRLSGVKSDKERASVISAFSMPNTREGLVNLLIFSVNQFNAANGQEDIAVTNAWLGKAKQAYELLKIQSSDDKETAAQLRQYAWLAGKVKVVQSEIKRKKSKRIRLFGILAGAVVVLYLFLLVVSNASSIEEDMPQNVRTTVMELIQEGRYDEARIKATEAEYSWERKELMEMIEQVVNSK